MKNEELKIFENRSDDWLAREREYENSVSVWDFDEAKEIKAEHHLQHMMEDRRISSTQTRQPVKSNYGSLLAVCIILVIAFVFVAFAMVDNDFAFAGTIMPIVLFVVLSLALSLGGRK